MFSLLRSSSRLSVSCVCFYSLYRYFVVYIKRREYGVISAETELFSFYFPFIQYKRLIDYHNTLDKMYAYIYPVYVQL